MTTLPEARPLILLNPGRISRCYMQGIAAAAKRLGLAYATLDLTPIWKHLDEPGDDRARRQQSVHAQLVKLVRDQRISHVIGYAQTGIGDLGLLRNESGQIAPIFASLGVQHILLWTDHPNWLCAGDSLDEPSRSILGHESHVHFLKSPSAAQEASAVLGWKNVQASQVGEDFDAIVPTSEGAPIHDVVAIVGGVEPLHPSVLPFLEHDDPEPAEIDRVRLPGALKQLDAVLSRHSPDPSQRGRCRELALPWLQRKIASPHESFWRLAATLRAEHGETLAWLGAHPRRWYDVIGALQVMSGWRRSFYLAWISRRVKVGLYGSSGAALGISQLAGADSWVGYAEQSPVYARGKIAININAVWDEEGLTHKPFQIAASGVACVHHATRGLEDAFRVGTEVSVFDRPAALLASVRELLGDDSKRRGMAAAMRNRGEADHRWEARLPRLLGQAG